MKEKLKNIFKRELEALNNLLKALGEQYNYIVKNEVFKLDNITKSIEKKNKEVASIEIERRKLVGEEDMKKILNTYEDEELLILYRDIKRTLHELCLQKDTNELLIKQQLGFTTQMLSIINPQGATPKIYNSYGKVKR